MRLCSKKTISYRFVVNSQVSYSATTSRYFSLSDKKVTIFRKMVIIYLGPGKLFLCGRVLRFDMEGVLQIVYGVLMATENTLFVRKIECKINRIYYTSSTRSWNSTFPKYFENKMFQL